MSSSKLLRLPARGLSRPRAISQRFYHIKDSKLDTPRRNTEDGNKFGNGPSQSFEGQAPPQLYSSNRPFSTRQERITNYKPPKRPTIVTSVDLSTPNWARLSEMGRALEVRFTTEEIEGEFTKKTTSAEKTFSGMFLRDSCTCPKCVDPNSTQKNFSTADIPLDIEIKSAECTEAGVRITWKNDIPGCGEDHVSLIPPSLLNAYFSEKLLKESLHSFFGQEGSRFWTWGRLQAEKLKPVEYAGYLENDDTLSTALRQLDRFGFVIISGVPQDEKSVEHVAGRIGPLRDTFYGRTWNVKSTPKAKNVAYTQQYLGLHMDLMYMHNPPGLQFLHCLKNTCDGGSSLLSDSFNAAIKLRGTSHQDTLGAVSTAFHYNNDGHYYYNEHKVIEKHLPNKPPALWNIKCVNYSPPFQAPFPARQQEYMPAFVGAMKAFADIVEAEENLFEYRMKEGDCVIFNNRRVLHGRREFDSTTGERWLKGCYVDTDVFESRLRVLRGRNQQS